LTGLGIAFPEILLKPEAPPRNRYVSVRTPSPPQLLRDRRITKQRHFEYFGPARID
jgi:hypothetical protein